MTSFEVNLTRERMLGELWIRWALPLFAKLDCPGIPVVAGPSEGGRSDKH